MSISICGHRVLVRVEKLEDIDEVYRNAKRAGIEIAVTDDTRRAEASMDKGTVVALGPDCWKAFYLNSNPQDPEMTGFQPWARVNDLIAFAKYSGKIIEDPETKQRYIVINDEDVVAVLGGMNG